MFIANNFHAENIKEAPERIYRSEFDSAWELLNISLSYWEQIKWKCLFLLLYVMSCLSPPTNPIVLYNNINKMKTLSALDYRILFNEWKRFSTA